jgi:hypothetical protein
MFGTIQEGLLPHRWVNIRLRTWMWSSKTNKGDKIEKHEGRGRNDGASNVRYEKQAFIKFSK